MYTHMHIHICINYLFNVHYTGLSPLKYVGLYVTIMSVLFSKWVFLIPCTPILCNFFNVSLWLDLCVHFLWLEFLILA